MAINPNVRYTSQDYLNLAESEERRYELLDGELYMVPSPIPRHQIIVFHVAKLVDDFVSAHALGQVYLSPLDVVLSPEDVLQPDIMYIAQERLGIVTERNIQGAPDLVIEVLSPATADRDRTLKRTRYARFGVREYWLVDPVSRTIEVLQASRQGFDTVRVYPEGTTVASPLLAGLQLEVDRVFA